LKFRVGCSGWSYKHWAADFYPRGLKSGDWFPYYASRFDTVELNTTFYRLPSQNAVRRWHELAPPGFVFAAKLSRLITHYHRLADSDSTLRRFLERIEPLDKHLGPLLVQLPPDFEIDLMRLDAFLKLLPADKRWVFEFRHRSWWTGPTYELLREREASFCIYDRGEEATPAVATSPLVYMRFHGPDGAGSGYSDRALSSWAERLRELSGVSEAYVYFNNDIGGHAPRDARRFREIVETASR
jgi:uncharacterized protein YecE (DUF72 family)